MVASAIKPKPAYLALQRFTRELSGYRIVRRIPLESDNDYAVLCANSAGGQKLAAWTLGDPRTVRLNIDLKDGDNLACVTGHGESSMITVKSGRLTLDLGPLPRYITLGAARLK